jgi:hypothetical protein
MTDVWSRQAKLLGFTRQNELGHLTEANIERWGQFGAT